MRRRIHSLIGGGTGYTGTFHSFCVSILQEDSHGFQYPKSLLVLDNEDINAMPKTVYEERGLTLRHMTFGQARDMIEIEKLSKRPDYYLDMIGISLDALKEKYLAATETRDIVFYGYLSSFPAGTCVKHSVFGPGTILDDGPVKQVWVVQFDGLDAPLEAVVPGEAGGALRRPSDAGDIEKPWSIAAPGLRMFFAVNSALAELFQVFHAEVEHRKPLQTVDLDFGIV